MKKSELQELKNKPQDELQKDLDEKQTHLRSLKFDLAAGKVKNVAEIHKIKKDIARIMTIINQGK